MGKPRAALVATAVWMAMLHQAMKGTLMKPPPAPTRPDRKPMTPPASSRSEEHTSELQSLMRISYAVFCLKKKKHIEIHKRIPRQPPTHQQSTIYKPNTLHTSNIDKSV